MPIRLLGAFNFVSLVSWLMLLAGGSIAVVGWLSPPMTGFEASGWVFDDQHVSAEIGAWDLKGCHYLRNSATGTVRNDGVWYKVSMWVTPDSPPGRPSAWRGMGRWQWDRPEPKAPIALAVAHFTLICDGEPVQMTAGPFKVSDPLAQVK